VAERTLVAVEVRLPTMLRRHAGGERSVRGVGSTVREVLEDLERNYPGIARAIFTEDGELHRFINIYLNDEDIRFERGLDTLVREGDVLAILPAVAGGRS
jgi:molybdopterin synthase sulfur carrier subunit